ncbi:hypothetical protein RhiJN_26702 [Ceratobasidium sp. AG-Ba]|nr:hypothetical protein RhiJN_26702 [Ceratobasidium sp. AG-Ba]
MPQHRLSPTERFRDELGYRLSVDAHLCLPSANILVGVLIDALDALDQRSNALSLITLRNVLSVSEEVLALGRVLGIPDPESLRPEDRSSIPVSALEDLQLLCLPRTCLDPETCPLTLLRRSKVLRTYLSIARLLSSYIGPQGVQDLVRDFNRPNSGQVLMTDVYTRRVPGVGPRSVKVRGEERRKVDFAATFSPPVEIPSKIWAPAPYQRNSRGWPITRSMRSVEKERYTFSGNPAKLAKKHIQVSKTGGWKSLKLTFERFSS